MKKYIFSLFILCFSFLFLAGCNSAQTSQSPIQLQATIAIEPEYDNITVLGKFIIAEKDNQSAIYSYNGTTYQLIAPLGTYVTEPNFTNCSTGNTLSVYTEEYDDNGNVIIKNGLIDLQGNIVCPLESDNFFEIYIDQFYRLKDYKKQETRFYDGNGTLIAKAPSNNRDSMILAEHNGQFFAYTQSSYDPSIASANIYNKDGNKTLSSDYKNIMVFGDYILLTTQDNTYGIIDWKGNVIIPFDYNILSRASNITDDSFQWFTVQDKTLYTDYLMNINGEKFLEGCNYEFLTILPDKNVEATKDHKKGVVTLDNEILIDFNYDYINTFSFNDKLYLYCGTQNNLKQYNKDISISLYDENYHQIASFEHQDDSSFKNSPQFGVYTIKNNSGNMGTYDYNGNIIVPFNYQTVKTLNATHYVVQQHNQYYLFDSQSQSIISQPFDSIYFNQELVIAEKNGKQSFFNHNCEPIHLSSDSITTLVDTEDKDTHYLDNQDGSKSIVIPTISDSGKKGIAVIPCI